MVWKWKSLFDDLVRSKKPITSEFFSQWHERQRCWREISRLVVVMTIEFASYMCRPVFLSVALAPMLCNRQAERYVLSESSHSRNC